ncbi:MAG: flagellar protein FliT [Lachnospiraceae bacterium]|nr:flagellar protein FliT [Lachnospiraceae bacterium]
MNETQNYLQMMIESLRKKDDVLTKIIEKNKAQAECIHDKEYGEIDWDRFNVLIAEKDTLIERINELDGGFQSVYDRIKAELDKNKDSYKKEIGELQGLITKLTDKGVEIQTGEERNRARIERVLMGAKKEIRKSRKSMQAVSNYYKSMSTPEVDNTGVVDKKK